MLKKLLTAAAALVFSLVTLTLVVLLGTVTHADAVRYADWVDATQVTDPLPGQLYAISVDGVIEAQLCPLTKDAPRHRHRCAVRADLRQSPGRGGAGGDLGRPDLLSDRLDVRAHPRPRLSPGVARP